MTLLSFIAIIASVLAGLGYLFSDGGFFWIIPRKDTPKWKFTLWKFLCWFDIEKASKRRKVCLKLTFSILIITALGCGFWDIYSHMTSEYAVIRALGSIVITGISFGLLWLFSYVGIAYFKDNLTEDYFTLGWKPSLLVALNLTILCIWVAVFVFCISIGSECIFGLICLSTIITAAICLILFLVGTICWLIFRSIFVTIVSYIEWLRK